MQMTAGDIFDKWSILRMKVRLTEEITDEFVTFCREASCLNCPEILDDIACLVEMNAKIWILEEDIRNGKEMPLEEVGRRAIRIRDLNRMRIQAKNDINHYFGDAEDIKINHASEDK